MTDKESPRDSERSDPADDPLACSRCGTYLSDAKRVRGDDYCDACQYELNGGRGWVHCHLCGEMLPFEHADSIDISEPEDYYPETRPVCPSHDTGGDGDGGTESENRGDQA